MSKFIRGFLTVSWGVGVPNLCVVQGSTVSSYSRSFWRGGSMYTVPFTRDPITCRLGPMGIKRQSGEVSKESSSRSPSVVFPGSIWHSTFVPLTKNERSFATNEVEGVLISVPLCSLSKAFHSLPLRNRGSPPPPHPLLPVSPSGTICLTCLAWCTVITRWPGREHHNG